MFMANQQRFKICHKKIKPTKIYKNLLDFQIQVVNIGLYVGLNPSFAVVCPFDQIMVQLWQDWTSSSTKRKEHSLTWYDSSCSSGR